MNRVKPTNRRATVNFDVDHDGQSYSVGIGHSDAAATSPPIEVFVSAHKTASMMEALARDAAILVSFAIQYGVPLDELQLAITRGDHDEPATVVGAVIDAMVAYRKSLPTQSDQHFDSPPSILSGAAAGY